MLFVDRLLGYLHLARATQSTTALVLAQPQLSGSWTRVVSENDEVLGWNFLCPCGWSGRYLHSEINVEKIHRCNCGRSYQLKQSLILNGAATKVVKREVPQRQMIQIGEAFNGDFPYQPIR